MFGLLYLAVILIYVFVSIILSKLVKKGRISSLLYWATVALIPVWFFAGHQLYPSYFKFKQLCQSETVNTYSYEKYSESLTSRDWLVPNRLVKNRSVHVDDSGVTSFEYVSFTYYPFGTEARILGASSGSAPSETCRSESNLNEFIKQHIKIEPLKQQVVMLEAKDITNFSSTRHTDIEKGSIGDFVWCDTKVVGDGYNDTPGLDISYLVKGSPIIGKHTIEKTVCTNEYIYIVKTPKKGNEYIQIYKYDYQGSNIENLKYPVPPRNWQGYPRKALIHFDVNSNHMEIGIEEFGRDIEPDRIYYQLLQGSSSTF